MTWKWIGKKKKDVEFYGFIHSHESRQELSPTDIEYATVIACLLEKEIVMGIIGGNNSFPVKFFFISKTKSVKEITYEVFWILLLKVQIEND